MAALVFLLKTSQTKKSFMAEEVIFERKKGRRGKIYFLIFFLLFMAIILMIYLYFRGQIVGQLNSNANFNLNNENEAAGQWQMLVHTQAKYQLKIPPSWLAKETGNDLLITSSDDNADLQPIKKARLGIQLVANPADQPVASWWQGLYANNQVGDYTKEVKPVVIAGTIGEQRVLETPGSNPLDLDYQILVNYQKIIYVFTVITEGYAKKDFQSTLEEIIESFKFPVAAPSILNLPAANPPAIATSSASLIIYPDWQLYESQDLGFKIEYPTTWHIYNQGAVTNDPNYWQIIFEDLKYQGKEIERPYIAVAVLKNQNNLNDWFNLQKEALGEANLLYNENYKVNDFEGIMFTSAGLGLNYSFATLFDNKIYHLWSLNFFPGDDTLMIYFKMLDSFRLLAIP